MIVSSALRPAVLTTLIDWQRQAGFAFRTPLCRAALAGEITLVDIEPSERVPRRLLAPNEPPTLIVLGDDGAAPTGPAGFAQVADLLAWTAAVLLHSAGGAIEHYQGAADSTPALRRVLLIETATARRLAWAGRIQAEINRRAVVGRRRMVVLEVRTRPGQPAHPMEPAQ